MVGCTSTTVTTTIPVVVTVEDGAGDPEPNLPVYAFDDTTYSGYHGTTNLSGTMTLTLPAGDYRFRADKEGEQYWSGSSNHCTVPGCTEAAITIGSQAMGTPAGGVASGYLLPDLSLLLLSPLAVAALGRRRKRWQRWTWPLAGVLLVVTVAGMGVSLAASDSALAAMPESEQGSIPAMALPGTLLLAPVPAVQPQPAPRAQSASTITTTRVISYTYDPLGRLVEADYSTGEQFEYAYDAVGNRTAMTDTAGVHTYTYDSANRLTSADGVTYTWDARGNLLSDGTFTYTYNAAGRMVWAEGVTSTLVYTYNASGLRVAQSAQSRQSVFSWDWASPVPEMLSTGGTLYLVGHETLGAWDGAAWVYHLPDALGSVRQEVDGAGAVAAAREWTPYGVPLYAGGEVGGAQAGPGYTGEWWDGEVGLEYLRARWYGPEVGRFTRRDPLRGIAWEPQSINGFPYVENNPIRFIDPGGYQANDCTSWPPRLRWMCERAEQGDLNVISLIYSGIVVGGLLQDKPVTAFLMYHFLMGYGEPVRLSHEFVLQSAAAIAARDNLRRSYLRDKVRPVALGLSPGQSASVSARMKSSRVIASDSAAVWYALGRFYIHADYEGGVARDCEGYYVSYVGEYRINDAYDWHGIGDPEGPLDVHIPLGEYNLWVPDEWAEDLADAGVAFEFYMYVHWFEKETIKIGPTWRIPDSRAIEWEPFLDLPPIWGTP